MLPAKNWATVPWKLLGVCIEEYVFVLQIKVFRIQKIPVTIKFDKFLV